MKKDVYEKLAHLPEDEGKERLIHFFLKWRTSLLMLETVNVAHSPDLVWGGGGDFTAWSE